MGAILMMCGSGASADVPYNFLRTLDRCQNRTSALKMELAIGAIAVFQNLGAHRLLHHHNRGIGAIPGFGNEITWATVDLDLGTRA